MAQQRCVTFTGRVQGVGFRWTARRVAEGHAITGWVQNLPDGSVELVAEGDAEEIDAFLAALRRSMGVYIREERAQTGPASGRYTEFSIRH